MSYEPFVANLVRVLEKHGYPDKRVALPLEKMYEVAYEKQLSFNKALEQLRERGIDHEKTNDKIIFFPLAAEAEAPPPEMASMMAEAMKMMQSMSPEQLAELQKMVLSMSDDEKAEMLKKAREMGLE
jgi:hypothetical protein